MNAEEEFRWRPPEGKIRLPLYLKWSGPSEYDLSDPAQRKLVYEIVLREGRAEDIRNYIDLAELRRIWDSRHVRTAWEDYWRSYPHGRE
ncbi:MAG: transcriptional regulator [Firmicutes bacterium]|nr:transcriptional regulator [Bacillota bacterium]